MYPAIMRSEWCRGVVFLALAVVFAGMSGAGAQCVAVCKDITVQLDASGSVTIAPADVDNGSNSPAGIMDMNLSQTTFSCSDVGAPVSVTLSVQDYDFDSDSCSATVTVQDSIAPVVVCKDHTVMLNMSGLAALTAANIYQSASDACGDVTLVDTLPASFNCSNLGANTATLRVRDANGNTGTCTAQVTVRDLFSPAANCKNVTVNLDGAGTGTLTPAMVNNGSTDNCGAPTLISVTPSSFTCVDLGAQSVTLLVSDAAGNSDSCVSTATVRDLIAPAAVCQNVTLALDATGNATLAPAAVDNGSSDNCGAPIYVSVVPSAFTCANIGVNPVTLTVRDAVNNTATCVSQVTITDVTPPTAVCQDVTLALDATGNAALTAAAVNNGSSDVCSAVTLDSVAPAAYTCANIGANTATLTVRDAAGNTATCTSQITVTDVTPPAAVCQNVTLALDAAGNATLAAAAVNNGSSDVCGAVTLDSVAPSAFTCANIGANPVTLTIHDAAGNTATCASQVTITDVTPPTAVCENVTLALDATGNATLTPAAVNNGSSDACGAVTLDSVAPSAFTCANIGANPVTLTLHDAAGNTATCASQVTVSDTTAPVAVCKDLTVALDASGHIALTPADVDNGSNDACGTVTLTGLTPAAFDCSDLGANPATLSVRDGAGNTATCVTTVTVNDVTPPTPASKNITVSLDNGGAAAIVPGDVNDGSSDECGTVTLDSVTPSAFACGDVGNVTVTLSIRDGSNNAAFCTATVSVQDPLGACVVVCDDSPDYVNKTNYRVDDTLQLEVPCPASPTQTYQWRKDGVNLSDGGSINGATMRQLVIGPLVVDDTGYYDCIYFDGTGSAVFDAGWVYVHEEVPAVSWPVLAALIAACAALGAYLVRRRRVA